MKTVRLAVTEFAMPSPLKGSIDVLSGFGRASELGLEIHQEVQAARARSHANYRPEVQLTHTFEAGGFSFEVGGRVDGLFETLESVAESGPRIEEIKSAFNVYEMQKRLRESALAHPYELQLLTYGYFYWLQNSKLPELGFHLVSTRNREAIDLSVRLDVASYESWLARRLLELVELAKQAEKRAKRRREISSSLPFPFSKPRSGQIELIETIKNGMGTSSPMLIQAPTGLGKTVGVLYPSLKEALARGQRVVYVTPKNSQHSVAEDAIERLQEAGAKLKSLSITAKSKLCFKNEPLCNPEYCEYAKDHYTKLAANMLLDKLAKKKKLTARTFKKMGSEFEVCPFELQLDAALDVETVICDYNYVFAPRSAFGRLARSGLDQDGKPNLVIDEAHNLPARAMDYFSPTLSVLVLENMREEIEKLPKKFRSEAQKQLSACIQVVKSCGRKDQTAAEKIKPPVRAFHAQDEELRGLLSAYLASDVDIQPRDVLMRLSFYWSEFAAALEFVNSDREEFFTTFSPNPATVKITCCDASEMLKSSYDEYQNTVAFSATLKPFEYYSQLMGLKRDSLIKAEFASPFAKSNRKLLIIPQISSKYSERERSYPRIAETISKITRIKKGNYFVFFPSFDFLERVLMEYKREFEASDGFSVIRQERSMRTDAVDDVLNLLREKNCDHLVFAVQGGVFSEGVDYPGEMAIGAFIVGPPLPNFDLEREKKREYYEKSYKAGFDYTYTYPAMAKAVQAAGRVIRSETDRGLIVLIDDRFTQSSYAKSMPQDWFDESPRELVSTQILKDVADFWSS
ncbi:MAG: ATP-dependent DNA helicase [Deltaproteobacteria bacterium]|jgi:DNA excision repair protein ERCC-2|nr:ATP-dependent DNA helicase [Deltaproteobacteria bacterium]